MTTLTEPLKNLHLQGKLSSHLETTKDKLRKKVSDEALESLWVKSPNAEEDPSSHTQASKKGTWVLRKSAKITDHYDLGSVIGNPGQYGMVKAATKKGTKEVFACKIVNKRRFHDIKLTDSFFSDLRSECYLMNAASQHPNIIQFFEVFEDINNLYMIMEKCDGGELFDRIQQDETFSEQKAANMMFQMLSAINYVHSRGIAHCDLKPENFLFRTKDANSSLVLIDFGMAKVVEWREYYKRMNGTPYYIAPEVLGGRYNEACDIWSLGVILFIMVFGFPPFFDENDNGNKGGHSDNVIYSKIKKGFQPKVLAGYGAWFPADNPVSSPCRDLIARMLRKSVADRITAEEALDHPWLRGQAKDVSLNRLVNTSLLSSIRGFKKTSRLQTEILGLLRSCNYLNSSQVDSLKDFFANADKNGDGLVSFDELFEALKQVDPEITIKDCQSIVRSVDANTDGYMDFEELLSSRINRKLRSKEARLRKVFKALDLDNNGKISADELQAALESVDDTQKLPLAKIAELIQEVDTNGDGEVDYEEFLNMFTDDV